MKTIIETKNKVLTLGFVGLGWIGLNRMKCLIKNPDIQAKAIVEPDKKNADRALEAAPSAVRYSSYEALLSDEEIDGIVIATPSALHAEQSIQALNAGKAVFCQKPLGRTAAEVKAVMQASKKNNRLLGVDLSYRFTTAFQAIYKAIQNKEIGKIFSAELLFHNAYGPDKDWFYDPEKSGGGCVLDLGIHLADLLLWSLDFPKVQKLQSNLFHQGRRITNPENIAEDFAQINFLTADNTAVNLQCSWNLSAGEDAVISARFYGTQGGLCFKNVNGSFYDFTAEIYHGTQTEVLVSPPDDWSGKAVETWAKAVADGKTYDKKTAQEHILLAEILDKIYER